jgi:hypothetical protein
MTREGAFRGRGEAVDKKREPLEMEWGDSIQKEVMKQGSDEVTKGRWRDE